MIRKRKSETVTDKNALIWVYMVWSIVALQTFLTLYSSSTVLLTQSRRVWQWEFIRSLSHYPSSVHAGCAMDTEGKLSFSIVVYSFDHCARYADPMRIQNQTTSFSKKIHQAFFYQYFRVQPERDGIKVTELCWRQIEFIGLIGACSLVWTKSFKPDVPLA